MRSLFSLLLICYSISIAQINNEFSRPTAQPFNPVIFETIPFWGEDTTSIELVILYRINPSFLYFAKASTSQQDAYIAKSEIILELLDDKDAVAARDIRSLRIERNSMPAENTPPSDDLLGAFSFKLKKGLYRIVFEIKDDESDKSFINRDAKINTRSFYASGLNISPIQFIEPPIFNASSSEPIQFYPLNFGGNTNIGQSGGCFFQIYTPDTISEIQLSWEVISKEEIDEDNPKLLSGEKCIRKAGLPVISNNSKHIAYSIKDGTKRSSLIFIQIPIERLEIGSYKLALKIQQDTMKITKDFAFSVIWPLQPRSLSSFNIALDALKHIAAEKEIDHIKTFNSQKALKAFREFWRKQNSDTTNAFNPAMAEYYRRVDESINRFSAVNTFDGYRTDRGRIFILFGSPTMTNRLLKPNAVPTELWTYEKLKQRFTFIDQNKSGNYILVKMEKY